jgi:Protein of unknown function (DUF2489)
MGDYGSTRSNGNLSAMITDRIARNESELEARQELVTLCRAMLVGQLSFFEGALRICSLRFKVGASENDPDIMAFVAIDSETHHLPPKYVQHLWSSEALLRLQPEFEKTEVWANSFASKACENLLKRFTQQA